MNAKAKNISIIPIEQTQIAAPSALLTSAELAARLAVPESWVREKTRARARMRDKDPLPTKALGKYRRFSWAEVETWLARQNG